MSLDPTKHQNRISDCHVEAGTINLNPTPSITVGTQVRLTGVVTARLNDNEDEEIVWVSSNGYAVPIPKGTLEVIRQPFKRGEVVWSLGEPEEDSEPEPFVIINDENNGNVDVCCCRNGVFIGQEMAELYERRP